MFGKGSLLDRIKAETSRLVPGQERQASGEKRQQDEEGYAWALLKTAFRSGVCAIAIYAMVATPILSPFSMALARAYADDPELLERVIERQEGGVPSEEETTPDDADSNGASTYALYPNEPGEGTITQDDIYPQLDCNADPAGENTYLIRTGATSTVTVSFTTSSGYEWFGEMDSGHVLTLTMQVPYLIKDPNSNTYTATLDKQQWIEAGGEAANTRLAIYPDLNSGWAYFDEDGKQVDAAAAEDGLTGTISLQYVGGSNGHFIPGQSSNPSQTVRFLGSLPENTGAYIALGMQCTIKGKGNSSETGDYVLYPDDSPNSVPNHPRHLNFVHTNLQWEQSLTVKDQPVLWDRYNYMVYEYRVENTSENSDSVIESLEFTFEAQSDKPTNKDILQEDIKAWHATQDGEITGPGSIDDPADTYFAGKPEEGGILIYDITEVDPETLEMLDTDRFSNADQLGLKAIAYQSITDGTFTFSVVGEKGKLVSDGDPDTHDPGEQRTYYIAVPYTTNLVSVGSQQPRVDQTVNGAVRFGANSAYSWSKSQKVSGQFEKPVLSLSQDKNAVEFETDELKKEAEGRLGWIGTYVIDGIKNAGNIPAYGPESDNDAGTKPESGNPETGPRIMDTVSDYFTLESFELQIEDDGIPETDPPALDQWFDMESGPILVEMKGDDGTHLKKLGIAPAEGQAEQVGDAYYASWTIGSAESTIAEQIEALEKDGEESWTGRIAFALLDGMPADMELPVRIKVKGELSAPAVEFQNKIETEYGQRHWVIDTTETDGHYNVTDNVSAPAKASYKPVVAVEPTINADAYSNIDGKEPVVGERVDIPLSAGVSGWKFTLGNDSVSKILPARFSTSPLKFTQAGGETIGYRVDKVTLSEGLLAHGTISRIKIYLDGSKQPIELTSSDLEKIVPDAEGNLVLEGKTYWPKGMFSHIEIDFERFDEQVSADDGAYVDLSGQATNRDEFPVTGTFETAYDEEFDDQQKSVEDTATLVTIDPVMALHTHGDYLDVDEVSQTDTLNSDGDQTQVAVPYDRDFVLWAEMSNAGDAVLNEVDTTFALPLSWETGIVVDAEGATEDAWTGFHTTKVILTKELLEAWGSVGSIEFYDADDMTKPALTLKGAAGGSFTDGKNAYRPNSDGDIEITEKSLHSSGVKNLKAVKLVAWKGMKVGATSEEQRVVFEGFEDAALGSEGVLQARSVNYFAGVRPDGEDDPLLKASKGGALSDAVSWFSTAVDTLVSREADSTWSISVQDTTAVYVSKMFFDAASRAAYYDGETISDAGARFTSSTTPDDEGHSSDVSYSSYTQFGEANKTLEIGYKAIGSYLFDFAQYVNAYNQPTVAAGRLEQGDISKREQYGTLLSGKTYNTGAELVVTQALPSDSFDAYYVKIHPEAVDAIKRIKVNYSDGTSKTTDAADWGGKANSQEQTSDGEKYLLINVLDGSVGASPTAASRDAFDDYAVDDFENGELKAVVVTSIEYTVDINQHQYADATNQTAASVDFGTWYDAPQENPDKSGGDTDANDASTAAIEVTGRFYRDDARADDKVNGSAEVAMTIGGDHSLEGGQTSRSAAQVRYTSNDDTDTKGKSDWSYRDYTQTGAEYKMAHLSSTAKVDVSVDSNFTIKGVHDALKLDGSSNNRNVDYDDQVAFASDQHFSVSFYRMHVPYAYGKSAPYDYAWIDKRAGDDWAVGGTETPRVAFADTVVLSDDLPVIKKETKEGLGYYGFLTTAIELRDDSAGQADLFSHLRKVVFTTAKLGEDGSVADGRTIEVDADDLKALIRDGRLYFNAAPEGQKDAPELDGVTSYDLELEASEAIVRYDVVLEEFGGSADGSREISEKHKPERSSDGSIIDAVVYGRPYMYKGQNGGQTVADALNTAEVVSRTAYAPDTDIKSPDVRSGNPSTVQHSADDQAYFLGYLIPFESNVAISKPEGTSDKMFDYASDNNTPNVATYEVRYWNRPDGEGGPEQSALIEGATLTTEINRNQEQGFRMRNLYIPKVFVDRENGGEADWFRASKIVITANGKPVELNLAQLREKGLMKVDGDDVVIDIEGILREDAKALISSGLTSTYKGLNETNTLKGYGGTEWDLTYTSASVSKVAITFEALNPDREDPTTVLDGGQYLTASGSLVADENYTFKYDGIFVDRTAEDFKNAAGQDENWNETSTPSFGKQAVTHAIDQQMTATVAISDVKSSDPNNKDYKDGADCDKSETYLLSNLVGRADIDITRGKKAEINGKDGLVFSYDRDENSMTRPESDDTVDGASNNIANGELHPGDYIDYTITLDAATDGELSNGQALPLERTKMRFDAPKGQRVVGWEVLSNTTGRGIAGKLVSDDAKTTKVAPQATDLSLDDQGEESYDLNRNLVLTIGEDGEQIEKGTGVKIRIITQMTDELETDEDYQTTENTAFVDDSPSYAGDTLTANVYVTADPKHDYVQQRYNNDGTTLPSAYDTDIDGNGAYDALYSKGYSRPLGISAEVDGPDQFGFQGSTKQKFYDHNAEVKNDAIRIEGKFTEIAPWGTLRKNDGSPAELTVSNIKNPTQHTQDMMVTVSFMKQAGTGSKAKEYQGFELTEAPQPAYPDDMPENNASPRKDILVEYFDTSVDNGDGTFGDWVTFDKLKSAKLPSSAEEASAVAESNGGVFGFFKGLMGMSDVDPIGASEIVRSTESRFHTVNAVRWTYYDVPATSDGNTAYALPEVKLVGVGRYNDTRDATGDSELNDSFGGGKVDLGFIHTHDEDGELGFETGQAERLDHQPFIVKWNEGSTYDLPVWRRVPVLSFQTQTFNTGDGSIDADWDPNAPQKEGYIPGETFWYKDTLKNMPSMPEGQTPDINATDYNAGAPNLEGELYNPVMYERIPTDYLSRNALAEAIESHDFSNIKVKWVDYDGNPVDGARIESIELVDEAVDGMEIGAVADYGGAMNYTSTVSEVTTHKWNSKGVFSDMDPRDEGVSEETSFALYKITFTNDAAGDGDVVMNVGDRIELAFDVTAAVDGLPQVNIAGTNTTDGTVEGSPAYFPRIGEYSSAVSGDSYTPPYANPLSDTNSGEQDGFNGPTGPGVGYNNGAPYKVDNENVLMDMDLIVHDAAFSGDKPEQSDRWEAFDASWVWIPGSAQNNTNWGKAGNNDVFLDLDSKTGEFQKVRYTPRAKDSSKESRDLLPSDTWWVTPSTTVENGKQDEKKSRDWSEFVTGPRTDGDLSNFTVRWGSGDEKTKGSPLVWAESAAHLQKAWLATASDFESQYDDGDDAVADDYKASRQYEANQYDGKVRDPHENPYYHNGYFPGMIDAQRGVVFNKYATTLQYNQDFNTRLEADNYGDRNLDGIEMIYVMPRGVEPDFSEGYSPEAGDILSVDQLGVSAEVLSQVIGPQDWGSDAAVAEAYSEIDPANVTVEVVQTPYSEYQGYDAPADSQDPGYYREGNQVREGETDLSVDPATSTYEAIRSTSSDRTSKEYADSSQPWVLKITVKSELSKWFGRDADDDGSTSADSDGKRGDQGYKINVNIPSHVFANNENGAWYDRLMTTPWEDEDDGDPSAADSYFSVLDIDHFEGTNADPDNANHEQVYGQDYYWFLGTRSTYSVPIEWKLVGSSPNMPSVNGYTVQNNSVLIGGDSTAMGVKVSDRGQVGYENAEKNGILYAQTGTRALMREPFVRTWNTVGDDGVSGDLNDYYLDTELDSAQMNVHVENRYWWDQYAHNGCNYQYESSLHGYATDGGSKGDLVMPVVTVVLPQNIAVVDGEGNPYPTDGEQHQLDNYRLSTATPEDYASNPDALREQNEDLKQAYDATVAYEQVSDGASGEASMRYVVRFVAKDPAKWNTDDELVEDGDVRIARIASGGINTFSFDISTAAGPVFDSAHEETGRSYENAYTYVSSKLPGFRFTSDDDIAGNPYTVGADAQVDRIDGTDAVGDIRLDAVQVNRGGSITGYIPVDSIDDGTYTVDGHQKNRLPGYQDRYVEKDADGNTPSVEDYTFRDALHLTDEIAGNLDLNGRFDDSDGFAHRHTEGQTVDSSDDEGLRNTLKLRISTPRLVAEHSVEIDPVADVPSVGQVVDLPTPDDERDDEAYYRPTDLNGAAEGERVGRDGNVASPDPENPDDPLTGSEPLQYGDTPWYSATLKNESDGTPANSGSIMHGKLVFAIHLPHQVSFYNKEQLTDEVLTDEDAGLFYLEYTHFDREENKEVTELLTPQDLIDKGWYVHISTSPNWEENNYTQEGYGKPDPDDPADVVQSETTKEYSHDGETLVFEFAAPNDATLDEFNRYKSLTSAARAGVHMDGYFGSGDSLTLKVKTRVDNVIDEDEANLIEQGVATTDDGTPMTADWIAGASTFYATVHDTDGRDWEDEDPENPAAFGPEGSWIRAFEYKGELADGAGRPDAKPLFDKASGNYFERPFSAQEVSLFTWVNRVEDAPAQTKLAWALPPITTTEAVDYDNDGDYTDVYTMATSGAFTMKVTSTTNRIDTLKHRTLVTNPDLGGYVAEDADLQGEQDVLLTQATNDGAAVNSFIVDWEVPYHGQVDSSVDPATVDDPAFDSLISEITTGIWEIPGSDETDAEGKLTGAASKLAEYEKRLRVFVLVRTQDKGYGDSTEGKGQIYSDVSYPKPGTSVDRDVYGGTENGVWQVIGSQTGYPVRNEDGTKVNTIIKTKDYVDETDGIKQIRIVVKAFDPESGKTGLDAVVDDSLAHELPIPAGFRLDIDADLDAEGKQDPDEVDPNRFNTGWQWLKDENGDYVLDEDGNKQLAYESPMHEGITDGAVRVQGVGTVIDKVLHLNHFVETPLRVDDTKYTQSPRSRAGFFRNIEHPWLFIDLDQYYFRGGEISGYKWEQGLPTLDLASSRMMKYKITLKNLTNEELDLAGYPEAVQDACTNPNLSIMLPFISSLKKDELEYISYDQVKDHPDQVLNDDYVSNPVIDPDSGLVTERAQNLNDAPRYWTYYVEGDPTGENTSEYPPYLLETEVDTDSVRYREQLGSDLTNNRQYFSFHFAGDRYASDGSRQGSLAPGESLVVEIMMPIREDANTITSRELLDCAAYATKPGSQYSPVYPSEQDTNETTAYITDARDANLNDSTAELMLYKQLAGLSYAETRVIRDAKTSTTQVDTNFTKDVQGAAAAPEGTKYTYSISSKLESSSVDTAARHNGLIFFDLLPEENDTMAWKSQDGQPIARNSQWHGWLTDLGATGDGALLDGTSPAIRLYLHDADANKERQLSADEYTLWVGPYEKDGAVIRCADNDALPKIWKETNYNTFTKWMNDHRANLNDVMHQQGFVTLEELQQYVSAHPDEEEALTKNLRAIWCQIDDENVHLPAMSSIELQYDLRAPLNLPKYLGVAQTPATGDEEADADRNPSLDERLSETVQWNSFLRHVNTAGDNNGATHQAEDPQAGVYIDAPDERGYIGDYVWLDRDWSREEDDTAIGSDAYQMSENGRKLIRGRDPETGEPFDNSDQLIDLDDDGIADDPGINGVKVELLNEYGLPVNRDGHAVVWDGEAGVNKQGLWLVADPQTGEPIKDSHGANVVATAGGPLSYTTESDYFGNEGYYILSDLTTVKRDPITNVATEEPMRYRLRFTFPEEYAGYAITTQTIGASDASEGVPVEGEVMTNGDGAETLVAVTTEDITIDPVEYDEEKFANGEPDAVHAAYDAAAVAYDMGIALPVNYEGTVWRDDLDSDGNEVEPIDGYLDQQRDPATGNPGGAASEQRIENARVEVHSYDPETGAISEEPVLDARGKRAVDVTDADGNFAFCLEPGKNYVLVSYVDDQLVKPTPYIWNRDPVVSSEDNDLLTWDGVSQTYPFTTAIPKRSDGSTDYIDDREHNLGYVKQRVFALGYVDGALGFVGDYVWNDENADGIQQITEDPIVGLKVTLERYWWDTDSGAWKPYEAEPTLETVTSNAGSYVFEVPTYVIHPDDVDKPEEEQRRVLAGYKVRIDEEDLNAFGRGTVVTRRNVGEDDSLDSDIDPNVTEIADVDDEGSPAKVGTHYLNDEDEYVIVADERSSSTSSGAIAQGPEGVEYDLAAGISKADNDAGLIVVPEASITGIVWNDKDGDGLREMGASEPGIDAEVGIPGQTVNLEQYYLDDDGKWKRNDKFGADAFTTGIVTGSTAQDGIVSVSTKGEAGLEGTYVFDHLPVAYVLNGRPYLAGYRLTLGSLVDGAVLTRYHASNPVDETFNTMRVDSDITGDDLAFIDRDSFTVGDNEAGSRPNNGQVILASGDGGDDSLFSAVDNGVTYDLLRVDATQVDENGVPFKYGGDAGECVPGSGDITGRIWNDRNADGIEASGDVWVDEDGDGEEDSGELAAEEGVGGVPIVLERYVSGEDGWALDAEFGAGGSYPVRVETASDGTYSFRDLPGYLEKSDGTYRMYAYRVKVADDYLPELKENWHITYYMQGEDRTVDSDLRVDDGALVGEKEYISLLRPADEETPVANRVTVPVKIDGSGGTSTFDVLATRDETDRDGGLIAFPKRDIGGLVWVDSDYNGLAESDEDVLAGKRVTLHRWVYVNDTWMEPEFDKYGIEPSESQLTDASGRYLFEDEPATVYVTGVGDVLVGYTISISGTPGSDESVAGLPVTAAQVDSPERDSSNSKVRRPTTSGADLEIRWSERDEATENRRVLDGKLVLAKPSGESSSPGYVIEGFDFASADSELRMNAGFGPFPNSVLEGVVWNDENYDGLQDLEDPSDDSERGLPDQVVYVSQYYLNDDGEFVLNELFGESAGSADRPPFTEQTTTDENGWYRFENLPSMVQMKDGRPVEEGEIGDDDFRLAAYRVSLKDVPDGFAVTRYHVGDDHRLDSDVRYDAAEHDLDIVELYDDGDSKTTRGDGYAILAEPVAGGESLEYPSSYNDVTYDTLRALGAQRGGDAGFVQPDLARIEGEIFEDADADGEQDRSERGVSGVVVTLTRFWRADDDPADVQSGEAFWHYDVNYEPRTVTTEADGHYLFDELPSAGTVSDNGVIKSVVYGYRVNVTSIPQGYAPTALNAVEDPTVDSDLDMGTTRMVPDVATSGLSVLADLATDDEDVTARFSVPGLGVYSRIANHDVADLDAGLIPARSTSIAGLVWEDENENGLQDAGEYLRVGQRVMLDRRVLTDEELEMVEFGVTVTDGVQGSSLDGDGEPLVPAFPSKPESDGESSEEGTAEQVGPFERLEFDGILSDGDWEEVSWTLTDVRGGYLFDELPLVDGEGRPYVYRVRMDKPDGFSYVPYDVKDNSLDDIDNDYAHLNVSGALTPEHVGVTSTLEVLGAYEGGANAYGQVWDYANIISYGDEYKNSVDLGIKAPNEPPFSFLPQMGDRNRLVVAILATLGVMAIAGAGVVLFVKRRRGDEDRPTGKHMR